MTNWCMLRLQSHREFEGLDGLRILVISEGSQKAAFLVLTGHTLVTGHVTANGGTWVM